MKGPRIVASRLASLIAISAALAAVGGAALAGAQSSAPDPGAHLLVVPDTAQGEAALASTDARVVARYDSFTLVEAAGTDDERLRRAGADRRDDMRTVATAAGELDPKAERPSLAAKGGSDPDETLALVQFVGPPKEAWLEHLRETGVRVVGYAAQNGYLVHAEGHSVGRLAGLVGDDTAVRAVTAVRPSDKLVVGARAGRMAVQTLAGEAGADARRQALARGTRVRDDLELGGLETQFLRLNRDDVLALAGDPGVVAVEPQAEPRLLDERASQIVAGNIAAGVPSAAPGYLEWLQTNGFDGSTFDFAIDVTDEGLDTGFPTPTHPDFFDHGVSAGPDRVRYVNDHTPDSNGIDCGGHGTNVASIAAGFNDVADATHEDAAGFQYGLGVAPFAQLGASKIFRCDGSFGLTDSYEEVTEDAWDGGARIVNNSWGGSGQLGEYAVDSWTFDSLVRDASSEPGNQEMVEVFAAGNDGDEIAGSGNEGYGTVSSPGTAKNVITVGATESSRLSGVDGCGVPNSSADDPDDIVNFSSRGPTDDGRLKPDVVAPGTHITGASPQNLTYQNDLSPDGVCNKRFPTGNVFYSLVSGTSQATPAVAGAVALVRDWYQRGPGGGTPPSAAMTKALLMGSATDVQGGATGKGGAVTARPNTDEGWGRVNLGRTFDDTQRALYDQTEVFGDSGDPPSLRSFSIPDSDRPVEVTLVWTDPPPATPGGNAWVNDLDLEVAAHGQTYLGNVLAEGLSRPGGDADHRNNVESVILPAGTSGRFSVRVLGRTIAGDGVPGNGDPTDQDFALVASNAVEQLSPVLVGDDASIDDSLVGNGDGFLEPGESFRLTEPIRNEGDDAATNVQGTLVSGSGAMSVEPSASTSAYPNLGAGAGPEDNLTSFEATLAGTAPCGADVSATLEITSDPGAATDSIPITIPTGRPGSTTDRTRTANVAIPDDNAAGVDSQFEVASAGRIKDLNVRIASLTHTWVGDLVIDVIGPDGTRVRLAEHPGGPDNSGNNFMGTIFDDDAPVNVTDGTPPYTGSFRPQRDSLSRFDGKPQQGTWTLRIRDLFENDTGTLGSWGTSTTNAECDPDVFPPETTITGGPPSITSSRSASLAFSSNEPGSTFECRIDAGDFAPCTSPKGYSGLAEGNHTFRVMAFDGLGQPDATPAARSWKVDATAPALTIDAPAQASTSTSARTRASGHAGTAAGDGGTVTVRLFKGPLASGLPARTLIVPRDGATGAWSADFGTLAEGSYTLRADQADSASNVGTSAPRSFRIALPAPSPAQAPSFVVAPAEARLGDALRDDLKVLAACASACRASAKLTVSGRAARRLGFPAAPGAVLGRGAKRLASAGAAVVRLRLTPRARTALHGRVRTGATLRVTISQGGQTLVTLKRSVVLRRSLGPRRIVLNGLRIWAACTQSCPMNGRLTVSAGEARRLGLRRTGSARFRVASGRGTASTQGGRLTLKVRPGARRRLKRAGSMSTRLEVVAGGSDNLTRSGTLRIRLRR